MSHSSVAREDAEACGRHRSFAERRAEEANTNPETKWFPPALARSDRLRPWPRAQAQARPYGDIVSSSTPQAVCTHSHGTMLTPHTFKSGGSPSRANSNQTHRPPHRTLGLSLQHNGDSAETARVSITAPPRRSSREKCGGRDQPGGGWGSSRRLRPR